MTNLNRACVAAAVLVSAMHVGSLPLFSADSASWSLTGGPATRGSPVTLSVTANTLGFSTSLVGFSAVITYSPAALSFISASFASAIWPAPSSDVVPYQVVNNDSASGKITIAVVADVDLDAPNPSVVPGASQSFVSVTFTTQISPNRCGTTTVGFDVTSVDNNILTGVNANSIDTSKGLTLTPLALKVLPKPGFVRGNANGGVINGASPEGSVTIADAIFVLDDLFAGGPSPPCAEAGDANNDGRYNLVDAIAIIQFLLGNLAVTIPAPLAELGTDSDGDALGCATLPAVTCP